MANLMKSESQRSMSARSAVLLGWIVSCCLLPAEIELFAEKGSPVPARVIGQHGWAPEIQAMMAHPARTIVWKDIENQPFPDKVNVAFRPKDLEELNSLFLLFSKVDTEWHLINVVPAPELAARFHRFYPKEALNCPLILSVHSAEFLKQWYLSMPVNAAGQRFTHNRVFDEPPPAALDSIRLYAKHPVVTLNKIEWPRWAVVNASLSRDERADLEGDDVLREIDELTEKYSSPNCASRRQRHHLETGK